ncbi:hypothetical protein XM53_18295 [Roseovarius atlanticus]|uniref:DUF4325 domain-containing protein n=1 Tax=Roseovarius atlanticus TaxID=1641875 RepID=A0A0T5NQQ8_9RHOB|nr:STAS-like domain-containing protein [Roseovarius atlanticus]KRS11030.1 hypothetical protein XM53_18295 [Roseovarius atlanticus]
MTEAIRISIAEDFSAYPIGRDETDSVESNGKKFRVEFLAPALEQAKADGTQVIVSFEGVESFGSSFLEEAFGGLVRKEGWKSSDLKKFMKIDYDWPGYARFERRLWKHVESAKPDN